MKVLATSDWHLDAVTAGVPRLREFGAYLSRVVAAVREEPIDLVLVLGDYFDPGRLNAHELTVRLMEAAAELAELAPTVMIAGNHDVVESSGGWTTLSPLVVAARCGLGGGRLQAFERPEAVEVAGVTVLALPYVARSVEMAQGYAGLRSRAFDRAAHAGGPLVVAGHLTVPGAIMGSETREMARGRDVDFPAGEVAALKPALVLNGHYHRPQVVRGPVDVVVPGSPHRFTFGEGDADSRGFVVAEVRGA